MKTKITNNKQEAKKRPKHKQFITNANNKFKVDAHWARFMNSMYDGPKVIDTIGTRNGIQCIREPLKLWVETADESIFIGKALEFAVKGAAELCLFVRD